ncbi:MAG TPA: flagellar hook capping FlgD N-terminal domain-containing protein [Lacunisphaera sp.]|nr:flagellar hook capping FlgD N-terminal domain-containing protein [Lacunisphaera sp.]
MSVSSIGSNPASSVAATQGVVRAHKSTLDSEDFMKLLAVQFQSQDPMKPMEDSAFIAQMAQFSALEQSNSLVKEMGLLRADQQNIAAAGFLGRTVTVEDADGLPVIGQVSAVETTDQGPALVIDGAKYQLSSVLRVELAPVTVQDLPPAA